MTKDQQEISVQSPYRRAIELLSYRAFEFDKNPEGILLLGYADKIFSESYVNRDTILPKYDELANYFHNGQIVQQSGTEIASSIYRAIEHSVDKDEYTILFILSDGDVDEVARATQAITDASSFPISICTICIGDMATADETFAEFATFDEKLFQRKFDNLHNCNFRYFYKSGFSFYQDKYCTASTRSNIPPRPPEDDVELERDFAMEVLPEIRDQYRQINDMGYKEVSEVLRQAKQ